MIEHGAEPARALLIEVVGPLAAGTVLNLDPNADLRASGIDSGDMIRFVLAIEKRYRMQVDVDDLDALSSIRDFDLLIARNDRPAADPTEKDNVADPTA